MTQTDLLDLLYEAQDCLKDAIGKLETYIYATKDNQARYYLVNPLKTMASADHNFLTRDINIDDLIKKVKERLEYEFEDEE